MHHMFLVSLLYLVLGTAGCWAQESLAEPVAPLEPRSEAAASTPEASLKQMHDYLISAEDLEVTSKFSSVNKALGISTNGTVHYILRKPNLLRVTANLRRGKTVVVSDGQVLTIHKPAAREYRQSPAPEDTLAGLYQAAGVLGVPTRMFDFFWSVDYLANTDAPIKLTRLKAEKIGGKTCDGFNVKYGDDDWSVWLERSAMRLPCRLISRRKDNSALITQTNSFVWKVEPEITAETFKFKPPRGDKEIGLGARLGLTE